MEMYLKIVRYVESDIYQIWPNSYFIEQKLSEYSLTLVIDFSNQIF